MTCNELRNDDIEAYVAGTLADADMTRVEQHMFDCSTCFNAIATLQAARRVLAEPAQRRVAWWQTQSFAMAASLLAVIGLATIVRLAQAPAEAPAQLASAENTPAPSADVVLPQTPGPVTVAPVTEAPAPAPVTPAPAPPAAATTPARTSVADALKALVVFDAPPVLSLTVRSAGQPDAISPALSGALRAYVQGDHGRAFTLFTALDGPERELAAVQYFGGISALKAGHTAEARRWLTRATTGEQASSAVEAWLYLAYARLATGDARGALSALDRYVELDGDRGTAARQLRDDIRATAQAR
ncbi:MAG: zf-HC2 domain-containing protein [Acidobacteria bacterium]|nr:zf-HC2 domain-containing protein [Acidobacteriota bacterium]